MKKQNEFYYFQGPDGIGQLELLFEKEQLVSLKFCNAKQYNQKASSVIPEHFKTVIKWLTEYFKLPCPVTKLDILLRGTAFQKAVWGQLQKIPVGQVWTYKQVAEKLGTSPRAVGNACRKNPVPLIVPCHRVVSVSGIGGFVGETQGTKLQIKHWLLEHEGVEF